MHRILAVSLVAMAFIHSHAAFAADAWATNRKIIRVYPQDASMAFIIDGGVINPGSPCEANRLRFLLTAANYDTKISTLLTAFAMGSTVAIAYDDTTITLCETTALRMMADK